MNLNKGIKFFGAVCVCTMFMTAGGQQVFAGPSDGLENEMVAMIEGDVSIYSEDDETSAVVAMAKQGTSYEVLELSEDDWVKVDTGEQTGYLKVEEPVILADAEEAAQVMQEKAEAQGSERQQLVNYALQFVGGRYQYGGNDPHTGVDCSGFTRYVMQHGAGIGLNRSSGSQAAQGRAISAAEMQPGDLIFYSSGSRINHVALYIGDGQIVHASTERTGIKISKWNYRNPVKIVSMFG